MTTDKSSSFYKLILSVGNRTTTKKKNSKKQTKTNSDNQKKCNISDLTFGQADDRSIPVVSVRIFPM